MSDEQKEESSEEQKFKDPFQQGIAHYKAGKFAEAEKSFRQSSHPDVAKKANFNLGIVLAEQKKYDEAIKVYESLLEQYPDHEKGKHNLETVKRLCDQQQERDRFRTVAVTSFDMPFGDMVIFMVKWALASIPAFIILAIIGAIFFAIFTAIFVSTR